jgi:hypothetical protein
MPIRSADARISTVSAVPRPYRDALRLDEPTLTVNRRLAGVVLIDEGPSLFLSCPGWTVATGTVEHAWSFWHRPTAAIDAE